MNLPYKKIGIIGALDEEVNEIVLKTKARLLKKALETCFYTSRFNDFELVIVRCGIGKVNASIVAQKLIDEFGVEAMINVGVAGSVDARVKRNAVVISEKLYEHDMDAMEGAGVIPRMKTSEFVSDKALSDSAKRACERICNRDNIFFGTIVSGDQFICSNKKKQMLSTTFGALCAEMEGAAIAHACFVNKIPFLVIRSISDLADEGALESFEENKEEVVDYTTDIILKMFS